MELRIRILKRYNSYSKDYSEIIVLVRRQVEELKSRH